MPTVDPDWFLVIILSLNLIAVILVLVMVPVLNFIRRRGAPWCPECKWSRLDFISIDEAAAILCERHLISREEARRHLVGISMYGAGPSGLPIIWRCRKCKTFWEMDISKGISYERSEDLHPPRLP